MAPFPHVAPLKQSGKGEKAKMWQMPSSFKHEEIDHKVKLKAKKT